MSEYQFLADGYRYCIHVGWDASIQSFFAIVADLNNLRTDRNNIVLSVGAEDVKLTEIEQLQNAIREYAEIPKAIMCSLEAERDGTQLKEYEICGTWEYWGKSQVRARSLKEAIAIVEKNGLPLNGYYVDDSFAIDYELLEEKYPDEADAVD